VAIPRVGLYNAAGGLVRMHEGGEAVDVLEFSRNSITNGVYECQLSTDARVCTTSTFWMPARRTRTFCSSNPQKQRPQVHPSARRTRAVDDQHQLLRRLLLICFKLVVIVVKHDAFLIVMRTCVLSLYKLVFIRL
jgi:hypothetical protein